MTAFNYQNGLMHVEGVSLAEIARQFGTPAYVYSAARLRENFATLRRALPDFMICYAVKANSNIAILSLLGKEGAGADIVSGGELARALKAGIPASRIVFSGVGKTDAEIEAALQAKIHQLNVESITEIERINAVAGRLGVVAPLAFRVNPDVAADTHDKIATGRKGDKFGIDHEQLHEAAAIAARLPHVKLQGLACHIGSQLFDLEAYRAAFGVVAQYVQALRAEGHALTHLDLGGGMGVPYNGETPFDVAGYAAVVRETLGGLGCQLAIEPGRYVVADAGVLLTRIIQMKQGSAHRFAVVDAAMNDLVRPAMYEAWHTIRTVTEKHGPLTPAEIVGPVCESSDCFASERDMPALEGGELLVMDTAGAYGAAMSSTYNTRALVAEVLVDGGRAALIRPRVDIATQMGWDLVPDWV